MVLNGGSLSNVSFYVDGVLDGLSATSSAAINTYISHTDSYKVRISKGVNNRYLNGLVDDVRIWSTNLSQATISNWKNLKVDSSHPNYSNLQLNYQFNETGTSVIDSSPNGNNATLIGIEFKTSITDGSSLFKNFEANNQRPNFKFYKGDYVNKIVTTSVDRPVANLPTYLMASRSIVYQQSLGLRDQINETAPQEIWSMDENIYNETTGSLITQNTLAQDGVINITSLNYVERTPYYNQLVSFVTPYGINLDLGMKGKYWLMDAIDYQSILKNNKRILMTLGGEWQEDMDLEFWFIVGTPPRNVVQYDQIWQGTNSLGSASIAQILADTKFEPKSIALSSAATDFKMKSSITGQGAQGEFSQNRVQVYHKLLLNNVELYNWTITQSCGDNPIYPQGGTWAYDRQGWCPGEETLLKEQILTPNVTPETNVTIDYKTSSPPVSTGTYTYHVAHQLVGYGSANHTLDAAVIDIITPNNTALYTRVGKTCGNPIIKIQNTGSTNLTSLTISYWMNGSSSPQTYNWTENLAFLQTAEVELPSSTALWSDVLGSNNKFYVEISNPNNGTDQYIHNNTYNSKFDLPSILPNTYVLEIKTIDYANQNTYQITDVNSNIVYQNSLPANNTVYQQTIQNTGCLKLKIYDTGNDGLQWWANTAQGTGYAVIKSTSGTTLKTLNPDFGSFYQYDFTGNTFLSTEELNYLTTLKIYPNPTVDNVFITSNQPLANAKIALINMLGQRFNRNLKHENKNTVQLDVSDLATGLYIVEIINNDIKTTRKLMIK